MYVPSGNLVASKSALSCWNTDHHINGPGFDDILSDFQFGGAGIDGGVCHDKARPSERTECAVEQLNPQIVGVIYARHPEREASDARSLEFALSTSAALHSRLSISVRLVFIRFTSLCLSSNRQQNNLNLLV